MRTLVVLACLALVAGCGAPTPAPSRPAAPPRAPVAAAPGAGGEGGAAGATGTASIEFDVPDDATIRIVINNTGYSAAQVRQPKLTMAAGEHRVAIQRFGNVFAEQRFTVKPGQHTVVRFDNDRAAAEELLKMGGQLQIESPLASLIVSRPTELPRGMFVVRWLRFDNKAKLDEDGFKNFRSLQRLDTVNLEGAPLTDAGLGKLAAALPGIRNLAVGPGITDAGLAHVAGLKTLKYLSATGPAVTGKCLFHFKGLPLETLQLKGTQVADGWESLTALTTLEALLLERTPVTGKGLGVLKDLPKLHRLDLADTRVDDAGLAEVGTLSKLASLNLTGARIGPAGLAHLQRLPLHALWLDGVPLKDADLAPLAKLGTLQALYLARTGVGDSGLEFLKGLNNLETLDLNYTAVSGAKLPLLVGHAKLRLLYLHRAKVTDAALADIAGLPTLTDLALGVNAITDAGLKHVTRLKGLQRLFIPATGVSDAGLETLKDLPALTGLDLTQTKVSDAALKAFRAARPKCEVTR